MKDNLEKAFKEKLDQFEAPYDASAWESMNSRLDAKQGAGGNSLLKWIIGSAAIIAVVSISAYFLNKNEATNPNEESKIAEKTINKVTKTTTPDELENVENNSTIKQNKEEEGVVGNSEPIENGNFDFVESDSNEEEKVDRAAEEETSNLNEKHSSETQISENVQSNDNAVSEIPKYNFIVGKLINNKVCKGESIFIRNTGAKNDIIKLQIDGNVFSLKKANAYEFTPDHSGSIQYLDGKNNVIAVEEFTVFENPNPEFNMKANIYEKGLPITKCETYGDYESVVWSFGKNKHEIKGRKATHSFFKKGEHSVTLTVMDYNGCKNAKTKQVRIDDDYNLMAVDAFTPNGVDPRNKVFMPFALTQRDVNFTLTIIDPRDNSVVYTTQDATKGWDGTDQRNGSMTPGETIYIWKVQLENPLPNERQVYAGTVVHD